MEINTGLPLKTSFLHKSCHRCKSHYSTRKRVDKEFCVGGGNFSGFFQKNGGFYRIPPWNCKAPLRRDDLYAALLKPHAKFAKFAKFFGEEGGLLLFFASFAFFAASKKIFPPTHAML